MDRFGGWHIEKPDALGPLERLLHVFGVRNLRSLWLRGDLGVGPVFLHMTTLLSPPAETGKTG